MSSTHTCAYCHAVLDPESPEALIVAVHRDVDADEWDDAPDTFVSGSMLRLDFCSQAHLAAHVEQRPLPAAPQAGDDDDDTTFAGCVGLLLLALVVLALVAGSVYGLVLLVREVF